MPHTQPPAIMQMTAICCSCGPASGTRGKKSKLPELLAEPVHHAPVPTSSMADPGSGRTLGDLPDELLYLILGELAAKELCTGLAAVNRRLAGLARCSRLWRRLFNDAYEAQPLHQRASEVAGSWKALYAEKTQTMAAANGWTRPSPSELAALLTCLSEQASTAALVSAAPAAAGCGASEPPSPRGPLSPAFSGASSASSLPMSPLRLDSLASQSSAMSISPRSSLNGSGPALVGASPESLSWHVPLHGSPPSAAATTFGGSPPGLGLMAAAAGGPGSRAKQPMQQQQPQQRAPQEAHVVYLLDGSGSVPEDFQEMRRFVAASASTLNALFPGGCKAGVVQFSTEARVEVPMGPVPQDPAQLDAALASIVRMNGGTNIATAIARAGSLLRAASTPVPPAPPAPPATALPVPAEGVAAATLPSSSDSQSEEGSEEGSEDSADKGQAGQPQAAAKAPPSATPHLSSTGQDHLGSSSAADKAGMLPPPPLPPTPPQRLVPPARLVLLLTDGRIDGYQARDARAHAARLSDELAGCVLAAFGVGRGVDRAELTALVGDPAGGGARTPHYLDLYTRDDAPW